MATLTIRNLPDEVRDELRVLAARNGRSMEAEARAVLAASVRKERANEEQKDVRARVGRLQQVMTPYRSKDRSVVDEFLAERREEVRREDEKWRRLEGEAKEIPPPSVERETQAEKLERARTILRRRVPEGTGLVDEFLAERRAMWGEE
jgi:plasmid stability protein